MTESFEEHLILVRKVLTTLKLSGIKIKVSKCQFFQEEVSFLGHEISSRGIRKSPEFIQKIVDYPRPATVTELRQFLGLVNFQRKFIDRCSVIAKPLTELTGGPKRRALSWTPEMELAFDSLKEALVQDVTLSFPNYEEGSEKLELFVDASGIGAGACLVQKQMGEYKTIAYASMTFSPAQIRYSTIERELVALRWGIKTFRAFLFSVPFILFTDHKPLLYLNNMARDNSRLMRTLNDLAEFDFVIKYRPGRENCAADAMSRIVNVPSQNHDEIHGVDVLPKGLVVLKEVEGGGDSFFESLLVCLKACGEIAEDLPHDCLELREQLVTFLSENTTIFNVKADREFKDRMKIMRRPGQIASELLLLVVCYV